MPRRFGSSDNIYPMICIVASILPASPSFHVLNGFTRELYAPLSGAVCVPLSGAVRVFVSSAAYVPFSGAV